MILAFVLTMPSNNSWNGKWSGDDKLFVVTRNFIGAKSKARAAEISEQSYYHNFGDGWTAKVEVRTVDSAAAEKLRKKSKGFCGYDWMIDSIIQQGEIRT